MHVLRYYHKNVGKGFLKRDSNSIQSIADEANEIADDIINLSKRIRINVATRGNEGIRKDMRRDQKAVEEGDKLMERAKRLIEKLQHHLDVEEF